MNAKPCSLLFVLLFGVAQAGAQTSVDVTSAASEVVRADLSIGGVRVPPSLEPLVSSESSYITRCKFVDGLKSDLRADEVAALLRFIASDPKEVGLSRGHFNSVADKAINALERQNTVPPELIDSLITMFRDGEGDPTWRDYCIQHLGSIYVNDAAAGKRELIRQVFDEAMKPEVRMAGTVVLALHRNIGQEGVSKEFAASKAAEVAVDEAQPEPSRLTAIQVAAELGDRDMLPLAREIVPSMKHSVSFRISSMATIGILGDASDLELLNKYTSSSDMRLRLASQAAVKKIEARLKE